MALLARARTALATVSERKCPTRVHEMSRKAPVLVSEPGWEVITGRCLVSEKRLTGRALP
jgi:hypothetical protein